MAYINHKTYREAFYLDTIYFYADETVSVFINWDDALEINSSNFYYMKGRNNETEEFAPSEINFRNNGFPLDFQSLNVLKKVYQRSFWFNHLFRKKSNSD